MGDQFLMVQFSLVWGQVHCHLVTSWFVLDLFLWSHLAFMHSEAFFDEVLLIWDSFLTSAIQSIKLYIVLG